MQRCRICNHKSRSIIEQQILDRVPWAQIAKSFGISQGSIGRHKSGHMIPLLKEHLDRQREQDTARAESLVEQMKSIQTRTLALLDAAETAGNLSASSTLISQARENIKLLANLTGELASAPQVQVLNVFASAEWNAAIQKIVGALDPHPQARFDVLVALGALMPPQEAVDVQQEDLLSDGPSINAPTQDGETQS